MSSLLSLLVAITIPVSAGVRIVAISPAAMLPAVPFDSARVESVSASGSVIPPEAMTMEAYVEELECAAWLDTLHGGGHAMVNDRIVERTDSVWRAIDSLTRRHIAELQGASLAPRYFLGLAHLEMQLGQDAAAEQHLRAWLRTRGVTTVDSVIAFRMAVGSLLRRDVTTARIALARQYVERLAAFPPAVANPALLAGRFLLMGTFDHRGETDSAVAWGMRAYAVALAMPYEGRAGNIVNAGSSLVALVRALAGLPNGARRIDSLLAVLKVAVVPRPAEVAQDTALMRYYRENITPAAENLFGMVAWVGKPMPPFVATHWLNQDRPATISDAAPGARTLRLDDGVVRIVGFGWFGCSGCQIALRNVQQSLGVLPSGVQVIFNERGEGSFNGDFVTPDEEADDLRKWYVERKHYTFPIAIWAPVKDSTSGGGLVPRESPLWRTLHVLVGPTVYIVDGRGVIRYLGFGFDLPYGKMIAEAPLRMALEAVVRERDAQRHAQRAQRAQRAQHARRKATGAVLYPIPKQLATTFF